MAAAGILITGFGGPDSLDAVAPFMCNLMGREPSDELIEKVCRRYLAIGGSSPLPEIAGSIGVKLAAALAEDGRPTPVEVGMRYWHPFIQDAMLRLKELGCERVISVSLSPFESKVASQACRDATAEAAAELGLEVVEAPLVSEIPEFAEYLASATAAALSDLEPNEGAIIAFTAHSLPMTDLIDDDPYVDGLRKTANRIAELLDLEAGHEGAGANMFSSFRTFGCSKPPRAWYLVYQSKGQKPGLWLEPDLDELIDACGEAGASGLVVCPIGFVTDHMETLYDLDVLAYDRALMHEMEFVRAPVPNDHEAFIEGLARAVEILL